MQQLSLTDPPIVRGTDPETSKAGAERVTRSGQRSRDQQHLLEAIRHYPMQTAMEYADTLIGEGLPWFRAYQVANKRISDLHSKELIECCGTDTCAVTGHKARIWRARD